MGQSFEKEYNECQNINAVIQKQLEQSKNNITVANNNQTNCQKNLEQSKNDINTVNTKYNTCQTALDKSKNDINAANTNYVTCQTALDDSIKKVAMENAKFIDCEKRKKTEMLDTENKYIKRLEEAKNESDILKKDYGTCQTNYGTCQTNYGTYKTNYEICQTNLEKEYAKFKELEKEKKKDVLETENKYIKRLEEAKNESDILKNNYGKCQTNYGTYKANYEMCQTNLEKEYAKFKELEKEKKKDVLETENKYIKRLEEVKNESDILKNNYEKCQTNYGTCQSNYKNCQTNLEKEYAKFVDYEKKKKTDIIETEYKYKKLYADRINELERNLKYENTSKKILLESGRKLIRKIPKQYHNTPDFNNFVNSQYLTQNINSKLAENFGQYNSLKNTTSTERFIDYSDKVNNCNYIVYDAFGNSVCI